MNEDELSNVVIGAAIEVHRCLGPGLLEAAYHQCLARELSLRNLRFETEKSIPVNYKGINLECGYRLDFMVEDKLIVELKAIEKMLPIYDAQMLTYLKLTGRKLGLIMNFNVPLLREGIKRIVFNL
ncbi:MAG: GxxExxY protein [Candidatus Abyssobacteria bacterium SURF_17]|uniref:GxxExxY protein n=1 Tax=Candidatus Abyssobacteria bacterium SURF_17 TaxID=2093361 RepID=A0A419F332_9BACT|nr:MAG: GxxExxY protein [Candidatus Abyssubacteria bacterium SURF_17]